MGFTSAGLPNNGYTAHYQISYDDGLSKADGVDRATALMATCEQDFALMASWFSGVGFEFSFPIPVQIANASGGASWNDPSDFQLAFGYSPTVTINPGSGTSVNVVRYLLVSEITEMFMASQKKGWYEDTSLFSGADEGSKGEGLSRFLGVQFQLANGLGRIPPPGFGVTPLWLNGGRPNFVDVNPDDHNPDPTTGCTACFLYYLFDQLGFTVNSIVANGSSNLAGVYKNLTGRNDGWTAFINLVNNHYPPGSSYNPVGDSIFPVSELSQFWPPNQITCGYADSAPIFIDKAARAELVIQLTSDDPTAVSVPPSVTVPVGGSTVSVPIQTAPIAGPFPMKTVNVHATYAGKTLTIGVEVVPPAIAGLTLAPDTVTCGDSSQATVSLNLPSLAGPVVVELVCGAPGFATVPAQVTIPQNVPSAQFSVTTPSIAVPFKTAHASIYASYSGTSAGAMLTVKSKVVAGIVNTLQLMPSTVTGGGTSTGMVTLIEPVPVPTKVSLAALEPILGPGGPIPGPPNESSLATVPSMITLGPGQTLGYFTITTSSEVLPGTKRIVQIMAVAVVFKYARLTVEA